jgi:hypothetical protein
MNLLKPVKTSLLNHSTGATANSFFTPADTVPVSCIHSLCSGEFTIPDTIKTCDYLKNQPVEKTPFSGA